MPLDPSLFHYWVQILMYAAMYMHCAHTIAFTGPHQTDQTKPAIVNCPQQTSSKKQPVISDAHGEDGPNQVSKM